MYGTRLKGDHTKEKKWERNEKDQIVTRFCWIEAWFLINYLLWELTGCVLDEGHTVYSNAATCAAKKSLPTHTRSIFSTPFRWWYWWWWCVYNEPTRTIPVDGRAAIHFICKSKAMNRLVSRVAFIRTDLSQMAIKLNTSSSLGRKICWCVCVCDAHSIVKVNGAVVARDG